MKEFMSLRCGLDDHALGLLAAMCAPQMDHLQLACARFGTDGIEHLLRAPWLSQTAIEEGTVNPWPSLRSLYINPLSDQGLSWLLDRSLLKSVRQLWVFMAGLTGTGFLALLRSSLPRSLVFLSLSLNHLGSLDGLPSSIYFPRLRSLELDNCHLGDEGAVRLLKALRAPNLRNLSLYRNELSSVRRTSRHGPHAG